MRLLLLVEDEPALARTFIRMFQRTHTVVHFYTVREALEYLSQRDPNGIQVNTPDVILTDRQVGWENGWSLKEKETASMRVVLMTGCPPQGNTLPFFHKGVDDIQRLKDMVNDNA